MNVDIEPSDINPEGRCKLCRTIIPLNRMYCNTCIDNHIEKDWTNVKKTTHNYSLTTDSCNTV